MPGTPTQGAAPSTVTSTVTHPTQGAAPSTVTSTVTHPTQVGFPREDAEIYVVLGPLRGVMSRSLLERDSCYA